MFWPIFFSIGIAQGLFLITIVWYRRSKNPLASYLVSTILFLMVLSNFGYLVIRTDLVQYIPQMYGLPWGTLFLFGPLLYFYSKSILDETFRWNLGHWIHFVPYIVQLVTMLPYFFDDKQLWITFIDQFLTGQLPINLYTKIIFAIQNAHLILYLGMTFKWIRYAKHRYQEIRYIVSVPARISWLTAFMYCMGCLLITVLSLYVFIIVNGKFDPITNYVYTAITSGIVYFMAYTFVLNPEIINPDFMQKYCNYMPFIGDDGKKFLEKLRVLLEENKIYTNTELKLSTLADELGLPQHQVSKLINDKFGKSFTELINEYRVKEVLSKINLPEYQSHTVLGIALDAGFNSKSSFNNAFKRITGKTPSEFKKPI